MTREERFQAPTRLDSNSNFHSFYHQARIFKALNPNYSQLRSRFSLHRRRSHKSVLASPRRRASFTPYTLLRIMNALDCASKLACTFSVSFNTRFQVKLGGVCCYGLTQAGTSFSARSKLDQRFEADMRGQLYEDCNRATWQTTCFGTGAKTKLCWASIWRWSCSDLLP